MDIFAAIADERRALADQLDDLTPAERWAPSLCRGWSVHVVLAHLVVPLEVGLPAFGLAILRARGSFHRANDRLARRHAERPFEELTGVLRSRADHRFTPPGEGPEAPLVDVLVHGLDIRRPLDLPAHLAPDRASVALTALMRGPGAVVPRNNLTGLRFEATDLDWGAGSGRAVSGSAEDLLLAVTGRPAGLAGLTGDGVATLRDRVDRDRGRQA